MTRWTARVYFNAIILSLCLLWTAQSVLATTVVRPLDDDMIVGARAIITGKVVQVESAIDERDRIFTYITVKVTEVIKGQISERKIVLKEFGGVVGDRVSVVYGNPQFTKGERVLLYLGTHDDGSLRTYQLFLGKFSLVTNEANGKTFAVRDTGGENVTILSAKGQPQSDTTDRMELTSYKDMVRTKLAANLARSQQFEETYYRNTPVLASPPNFVSSKKEVHSEYTFLGNVRWFQPDTGLPVPYTINPTPAGSGAPQVVADPADIAAAAGAWTGVPGCALTLAYTGTLDTCYTQTGTPGVNFVSNNCDGHNQPTSGCASILAIGGWSGGGFLTRVLGGITFGQITQGFVSFNPWASCYFSDHCNFREIATHELGHALGLGHTADSTGTMYAFAHFDGRCASIKQDDMNGIAFLYPGSGGGPGPLSVVTSALAGGTVGTGYSQPLTGTGGTIPYSWSLVAGQGTLPTGLNLSAGGTISGTPSTAGTFNFTVKVTDATQATAQKALSIAVAPVGSGPLNSQFVSQTVPTSLQPGQTFTANMKFLNTGTQSWSGQQFFFASQNPALNQTWGGNAVSLVSFFAGPGDTLDVTFQAVAPTTPGTYNFQWQMYKDDGSTNFFGQMSTNVPIQVGSSPPPPPPPPPGKTLCDFDADGKADLSIFRPSSGEWYLVNSSTGATRNQSWGVSTDIPVSADYDGDGKTDIAIWRPSDGSWWIIKSSTGAVAGQSWGVTGDVPVPGDYDGDGKADVAVWRPSNGTWYIINSSTGSASTVGWGISTDKPVPGDFDGDGKTDIAVWRPSDGSWWAINSSNGSIKHVGWGVSGDKPVAGDYDGDGKTDIAVWRPSNGVWYVVKSSTGATTANGWGVSGDMVVPADYDGDGKTDFGIWRPSTGVWYIVKSTTGSTSGQQWGLTGDKPVPEPR